MEADRPADPQPPETGAVVHSAVRSRKGPETGRGPKPTARDSLETGWQCPHKKNVLLSASTRPHASSCAFGKRERTGGEKESGRRKGRPRQPKNLHDQRSDAADPIMSVWKERQTCIPRAVLAVADRRKTKTDDRKGRLGIRMWAIRRRDRWCRMLRCLRLAEPGISGLNDQLAWAGARSFL